VEKTDNRILLRLRRNHFFQNSISYCQNHFLGQRFGTQFFDIEEIEFSGINYKKIEEKMSMSTEFAKKLTRICRAQNEAEIREILSDSDIEAENRELKKNLEKQKKENCKLVSELKGSNSRNLELSNRIQDLQRQLENRKEKKINCADENLNDSNNKLKRKARDDEVEENESKKRRIE